MNLASISFENQKDSQIDYPISVLDEQSNQNQRKEDDSIKPDTSEIFKFLNIKVTTILTFSIAIAIGFALKDFMNGLVINILQPSIMSIIMYVDSNNYLPITQSLREKQVTIDVAKFLGNLLVLKLVIGSMYFVYKYSNIVF